MRGRPLWTEGTLSLTLLCSYGLALTKSHLCPGTCPQLLGQPHPHPRRHSLSPASLTSLPFSQGNGTPTQTPASSGLRPLPAPHPHTPPMFFRRLFLLAWGVLDGQFLAIPWAGECLCHPCSSSRSSGQTRQWPAGPPFQKHVPDPVLWGQPPESPWACVHASQPGAPPFSPLSTTSLALLKGLSLPAGFNCGPGHMDLTLYLQPGYVVMPGLPAAQPPPSHHCATAWWGPFHSGKRPAFCGLPLSQGGRWPLGM